MDAFSLQARAKINLSLQVGSVLPSGYHQVNTVLQSIDLADELAFETATELIFDCDDPELSHDANLVVAAAKALQEQYNTDQGAKLSLRKRIPVGAGLGGGSADAAAALIGLARLWELDVDLADLRSTAATVGADVPFCLSGGTALATGYGEQIKLLPDIDLGEFLIVKPTGSLDTGTVYREWDRLTKEITDDASERSSAMLEAIDSSEKSTITANLFNDLELAAERLLPDIRLIKDRALAAGAARAMVTGSGSAIIVLPPVELSAHRLATELADSQTEIFVVHCVDRGVVALNGH